MEGAIDGVVVGEGDVRGACEAGVGSNGCGAEDSGVALPQATTSGRPIKHPVANTRIHLARYTMDSNIRSGDSPA